MYKNNKIWLIVGLLTVLVLILAGCAKEETPVATEPPAVVVTEEPAPVVTEAPATEAPSTCTTELWTAVPGGALEKAYAGEMEGKVVTMLGPFTEGDIVRFEQSILAFEEKTGIDIQYEGTKEFEATIGVRVDAGDVPDIVDFPQPGLLSVFFAQGKFIDPTTFLPLEYLQKQYGQGWLDMAAMAGPDGNVAMGGIWARFNGKSQVWYPKDDFDAAGYTIPTTWEELLALSDQIVADGDAPWCVGIESGAATGWPATDWMEEFMLRTTTPENYDKWVKGELKFDSPEVRLALQKLSDLWLTEGYVYGGQEAIATTFFGDAPAPMFEQPPKCWLHKQGNFITAFFPEGVKVGTDYDFFYLPGIDPQYGDPYLVAGDIYAMWRDAPEVQAVYEYFTKAESLKEWISSGGAMVPHNDACLDWYTDPVEKKIVGLVQNASTVRFDASDLMPGAVGAGSFWKGMTDYFSGAADMDTVLKEIDASWPESATGVGGTGGETVDACTAPLLTSAIAGGALEQAYAGELDGKVVTMLGPFTEGDIVRFEQSILAFEEKTGIDIQYEGTKEFEATIGVRVDAGDVPDIVDFPQPGLLSVFFGQGKFVDPTTFLPPEYLQQQYTQGWLDMATMANGDGELTMGGIWARFNGKSQVWYPKDDFDAAGYTIPTTWEELLALSDQIVADGDAPWCVGIESGAATGWPATDWMEEFMLRTTTPENYDKWVKGELKFDSPEVRLALQKLSDLWLTEGYVYGGQEAIATTFFGDAPAPMFEQPPKCWLHKQGNFITAFFPEGVKVGTDYDFFYLPGIDPQFGNPYLVAGDIYAMWRDAPEVRAVYEYFTRAESLKEWISSGGAMVPHNDACLDWYTDPVEKKIVGLVQNASTVRFDASDLMPGAVGSGSFWKGMTDYFSGAADMDTVLKEIDASWP